MDKTETGVYAGWRRYERNPVFPFEWGETFDATVITLPDRLRVYFGWRLERSIAVTDSRDGIHWSFPVKVISPDPSVPYLEEVNRNIVLIKDGIYHLWFNGQGLGELGKGTGISYLCYASSKDGVHFDLHPEPIMKPELPWEGYAIMCPHVIWDEEDYLFKLWYSAGEYIEPDAIGYATSDDGIHWKRYINNPIFNPVRANYWEKSKVGACSVFKRDGWYYMSYIGYEDIHRATTCLARSRDGLEWERHPLNPVISFGAEGEWDYESNYKATMYYDDLRNRWFLWYNAGKKGIEEVGLAYHNGYDLGFDLPKG
jgi:predicted GH43/DUF377 family glycosyl hydrolase